MGGVSLRYETFVISEEDGGYVARDKCGSDDFAVLEIQSDSLDVLMTAMKQIIAFGMQPFVPNQPAPMPKWFEPYQLHGDCSRIHLPSGDQKRLFEMTQARKVLSVLAGAAFAFVVWAMVSVSTHPLLVDIDITGGGFL